MQLGRMEVERTADVSTPASDTAQFDEREAKLSLF